MTKQMIKKQMGLAVACAVALGCLSGAATAQGNPTNAGYLTDQRGTTARSGFGLCWHAGSDPAPASTAECDPKPAPPPVATVNVPAPPVAASAPVIEHVTLDADALFDFDKAVLRPAGKTALDNFAVSLEQFNPEMINAVGHTDRLGSESYNQHLSEMRVEAVKDYLVSRGIDPSRIHVEGRGESQPVTKPEDCAGRKSAKVIACLQPDRRVDIEVIGSRVVSSR